MTVVCFKNKHWCLPSAITVNLYLLFCITSVTPVVGKIGETLNNRKKLVTKYEKVFYRERKMSSGVRN